MPAPKTSPQGEVDALTVEEFCRRHNISRTSFYELLKDGLGPRCLRIGSRRLISREAAADWRRQMEQQAARQPDPKGASE